MLEHVLTCHAYGCAECPKHFSTTAGLKYHYKKAHFSEDFFGCNNCGKHFSSINEMKNHQNEKHGIKQTSLPLVTTVDTYAESNYIRTSEFDVDTGDEAYSTPYNTSQLHPGIVSTATINSDDKGNKTIYL